MIRSITDRFQAANFGPSVVGPVGSRDRKNGHTIQRKAMLLVLLQSLPRLTCDSAHTVALGLPGNCPYDLGQALLSHLQRPAQASWIAISPGALDEDTAGSWMAGLGDTTASRKRTSPWRPSSASATEIFNLEISRPTKTLLISCMDRPL